MITVRYVTHFIPGISLVIVCLGEEIDDDFAFLVDSTCKTETKPLARLNLNNQTKVSFWT